jgi:hypothetical protein
MNYLITKEWSDSTPYYFYKTTNIIDGKFYYGSGSKENYLGSGIVLNRAIKKYGKENFKIEKLRFFESREDAYTFEDMFLNIFKISDLSESYNIKDSAIGFENGNSHNNNKVLAIDKYGETHRVDKHEFDECCDLMGHTKGKVSVKDTSGNCMQIAVSDNRYISGELTHVSKGLVASKDTNNNILYVPTNDIRLKTGELKYITSGKVIVSDKDGNRFSVDVTDERYLSGELVALSKGRWTWNKLITICGDTKNVKEWTNFYGLHKIKYLKEYLNKNNIVYG